MSIPVPVDVIMERRLAAVAESNAEQAFELETLSSLAAKKNAPLAPFALDPNLFRSDGNVHSLALPSGRPGGKGSSTVLEGEYLYCRIPSDKISGEQLYHFLRIQFGIEIESPYPSMKVDLKGNHYCFLRGKTHKDQKLLK